MSSKYVHYYHEDEVKALNDNEFHFKEGVPRRRMYENEVHGARYTCNPDKDLEYIIHGDRHEHPDHSSRFGYNASLYGYTHAVHPGLYHSADQCRGRIHLPKGMAPPRFYEGSETANVCNIKEL